MGEDKNGELLGIEFQSHAGGKSRLRLVYPGGTVTHIIPSGLSEQFGRSSRGLREFFVGKIRKFTIGRWAGPE